jgi:phage tail protein X
MLLCYMCYCRLLEVSESVLAEIMNSEFDAENGIANRMSVQPQANPYTVPVESLCMWNPESHLIYVYVCTA